MNEADNQIKAVHKILGYNPLQKSFSTPKYVIRAKDPQLHKITVAKHGFLLPEGSSILEGVPLAGLSSSHQATEAKVEEAEREEEVANLGPSEDEFGVFNQVNSSEDPSGDLGDPNLSEADLLPAGTDF